MVQQAKRISALPATTAPDELIQLPVIVGDTEFTTYRITKKDFLGGVYDVREYGAVAGTTDSLKTANTVAIQAAITACGAAGGGIVYFPPGTWVFFPVGIINSNVHIRGAGRGATKVKMGNSPTTDQDELFRFGIAAGASSPTAIYDCSIGGMEGDGNKSNQVNGTDSAGSNAAIVGVATVSGMTIFDMEIHDCDGYGVSFFGTDFAGRSDWLVHNVETHHNNYDGVDIKGGATNKPTRITLSHVYSHDNGPGNIVGRDSVGFDLRGENITLIACRADANTQNGIRIRDGSDGCYSATITGCSATNNTTAGLQVDGVSTGVYSVHGSRFYANSDYGVRQEGGTLSMHGVHMSGQKRGYTNFTTACRASLTDCIVQDASEYGVRVDIATSYFAMRGGVIQRSGLEGSRFNCADVDLESVTIIDNDQTNANKAGVVLQNGVSRWRSENCRITNVAGATQNWAFDFGASVGSGWLRSHISGNSAAEYTGNLPNGTTYFGPSGTSVAYSKGANLTIASGVVTVTANQHAVDTEGAAASDDLDTINGTFDQQIVIITALSSARTVVLKDSTGNLSLNGDFSLTEAADRIVLQSNGTTLFELSRSDNAA